MKKISFSLILKISGIVFLAFAVVLGNEIRLGIDRYIKNTLETDAEVTVRNLDKFAKSYNETVAVNKVDITSDAFQSIYSSALSGDNTKIKCLVDSQGKIVSTSREGVSSPTLCIFADEYYGSQSWPLYFNLTSLPKKDLNSIENFLIEHQKEVGNISIEVKLDHQPEEGEASFNDIQVKNLVYNDEIIYTGDVKGKTQTFQGTVSAYTSYNKEIVFFSSASGTMKIQKQTEKQDSSKEFEEKRRREQEQECQRIEKEKAKEKMLTLYERNTGGRMKGMMIAVSGGILASGMGLGTLVLSIFGAVGHMSSLVTGGTCFMAVGALTGVGLLAGGIKKLGKLERFQKYIDTLGNHTYCNFEQLSAAVNKPVKFVKKDIKKMIDDRWFRQGHIDEQETCLITSNETYLQYTQTQKALEQKKQEEEKYQAEQERNRKNTPPEVQEVLDKGNEFLDKIHRSNDAIPGVEISAKISRMELIVEKIFERAQKHPEIIPDLKKLMNYYLPMTVKLLDAYEEMDQQPVQGENIQASKKEIEDTLDTLNQAFEKLLDSVFQDTAWDVSSDISVLHTLLAQEGLTDDDFAKMKKN